MTKIKFKPTKLSEPVGVNGTLKVGETFSGELIQDGKIYFKDTNDREWVFYVGDTADIVEDTNFVFSTNSGGNLVLAFTSDINLDNGFTNKHQGVFSSTMELFTDDDGLPCMIEWDADIDVVHIGLEYSKEDGGLVGYDGVFELPSQAIRLIRHAGFIVPVDFEDN